MQLLSAVAEDEVVTTPSPSLAVQQAITEVTMETLPRDPMELLRTTSYPATAQE